MIKKNFFLENTSIRIYEIIITDTMNSFNNNIVAAPPSEQLLKKLFTIKNDI